MCGCPPVITQTLFQQLPSSAQPPLPVLLCSNGKAAKALTEIGSPAIDWVALAQVRRLRCGQLPCPSARALVGSSYAVPTFRASDPLPSDFSVRCREWACVPAGPPPARSCLRPCLRPWSVQALP